MNTQNSNNELSQEEIEQRVAVLKRFRKLLEQQRAKFQEYLSVLEKQECSIMDENEETIFAHAELEGQIVSSISNLQRVINPIEDMYKNMGSPKMSEIHELKCELEKLQNEVLEQNEKNRELLKMQMEELKEKLNEMNNPKFNPYAKRRSVYSQMMHTAAIFDIQG